MDTNLFLEQFGHLAQSPDGVQKLRNLILELAVRGKLVPQNPDDEPASELLKRIEAAKANIVRAGQLKKADNLPPIADDEKIYELPYGWEWIRLGNIIDLVSGQHLTPEEYLDNSQPNSVPYITGPAEFGTINPVASKYTLHKRAISQRDDILITVKGAGVGKLNINSYAELAISRQLMSIRALLENTRQYMFYFLLANYNYFQQRGIGTTVPGLSRTDIQQMLFPLPPLAEQHRIVAKVDELMQLCDQLEQEQTHRDQLRQYAAQSTLHHLTAAATPAEPLHYWQQAEHHFDRLFDRVSTIADLRAAILELAVRGRLVPQDPADEPASEMLKQLEGEKKRLTKANEIKPTDSLPPVSEDEMPYKLPQGWEWVRLGMISFVTKLAGFEYTSYFNNTALGDVPIVRARNVKKMKLNLDIDEFIPLDISKVLERSALTKPCLLITFIGAGIGDVAIYNSHKRHHLAPNVAKCELYSCYDLKYILYFLLSPSGQNELFKHKKETAQPSLSMGTIRDTFIASPPLAEQHRIVAKVDELMQLCDQLEQQAGHTQQLSAKLMDSVIYHLFETTI